MWIWGGTKSIGIAASDLWAFDFAKRAWKDESPPRKTHHSLSREHPIMWAAKG